MRLGTLPLALPPAGEAHGRPQLPRLRLLAARNIEGLAKARFRLRLGSRCWVMGAAIFGRVLTGLGLACDWPGTCFGLKHKRPFESIQLRLPPTFPALVDES